MSTQNYSNNKTTNGYPKDYSMDYNNSPNSSNSMGYNNSLNSNNTLKYTDEKSFSRVEMNDSGNTATAQIKGGPLAPDIRGVVTFRDVPGGVLVCANIAGLPSYKPGTNGKDPVGPHGFHIHQYGNCQVGNPSDPFKSTGEHWNPDNQPHGNHAGDFPVLFSNKGYSSMCFFTDKFKVSQVKGKAVIVHENPDDYRSQPAGNSGKRLACGLIL